MKGNMNLFGPRLAGFDDPIEMLEACHERIESQCDTLIRLVAHVRLAGADESAIQAARAVMRYFDTAGVHHHDDEEQDLFPRLRKRSPDVGPLIDALNRDHEALSLHYGVVRAQLEALDGGRVMLQEADVVSLCEAYRAHIVRENAQVLPLARTLLLPADVALMGAAMARRRGSRS